MTTTTAVDLHGRTFLKLLDYSPDEIRHLLALAAELKAAKKDGTEVEHLRKKEICLIFEKTSTRTRCSFEVAAYDQGAHVTYLDPGSSQMGHKETIKDTARVLGRLYDGIEYRGFDQEIVEVLAANAGVPVWNGLTDEFHPTQILADILTMTEHSQKPLEQIAYAYLGDARNNMGNSLLVGGALLGMDVRLVGPRERWPEEALVEECKAIAAKSGARITRTSDCRRPGPVMRLGGARAVPPIRRIRGPVVLVSGQIGYIEQEKTPWWTRSARRT